MIAIRELFKNSVWFQGAAISLLISIIVMVVFINNQMMTTIGEYTLTFGALFVLWWLLSTFIIWIWRTIR